MLVDEALNPLSLLLTLFSPSNRDAELSLIRKQRNYLCDLMEVPKPQLVTKVKFLKINFSPKTCFEIVSGIIYACCTFSRVQAFRLIVRVELQAQTASKRASVELPKCKYFITPSYPILLKTFQTSGGQLPDREPELIGCSWL